MKNTPPLEPDTYYHIYNRGINGESIFKSEGNYSYFLVKYDKYITPIADTFAYCLLNNHFHFLIRTRCEKDIIKLNSSRVSSPVRVSKTISLQFSHFFNGYTQAFNKQNCRTGKLFELPFRRIKVASDEYFSKLVFYIHSNPQKHGLIDDFKEWPYSSYHSHLSDKSTKLSRKEVLQWFGGSASYINFHTCQQDTRKINPLLFD